MKILKENIIKTISVILVAATVMLMPNSAFGLTTGFNVEITNNTGQDAYDFHLEGRLKSEDRPKQLKDWCFESPQGSISDFDWKYDGGSITHDVGHWYNYSGGWSGSVPVRPGDTIHIGKYFDETCNNIVYDLRGWWTDANGVKINPLAGTKEGGTWISDVPLLGFDIRDNVPGRLFNPDLPQTVTLQNATNHEIEIESPQVAVTDMHITLDQLVPDSEALGRLDWYDATDAAVDGFNNTILAGQSMTFDLGRIGLIIGPSQETILRCRVMRVGANEWEFYAAKCTAHRIREVNPVGIFENAVDVGNPTGIGSTVYEGYVWKCDVLSEQYLLTGGGHDIWDNSDDFHYAYNTVSGDVRLSACFEWITSSNDWAKYGVMLRNSLDGGSVHRFMSERGLADYAGMQGRTSADGGSSEMGTAWTTGATALGIQRVTIEGLTFIEGLAKFGDGEGWVSRSLELVLDGFEDEILAGVAITSHDDSHLVQARCWNVSYEANTSLVGSLDIPLVPSSADLGVCPSDIPGFSIRSLAPLVTDGWGYDAMNELLDTGMWMGLPAQPGTEGTRIDEFVNLRDTGNGAFSIDNGYPDAAYPGIDPDEVPAQDPAAGDDDDNFATEILGCIQLTAGLHMIGANSDDGTIIEIGGVEIGRTGEWKGASNEDFLFEVETDGCYDLRARTMEGGGGASIELHEVLMDGTRILLNDVANGGSAVFTPVIPLPAP